MVTTLRRHVQEYLAMRRRLGFKLTTFGDELTSRIGYLEHRRRRDDHPGRVRLGDGYALQHR